MSDVHIAVKNAHENLLAQKASVNGVGVGVKWVNGQPTSDYAILVFVEKKLTKKGIVRKFSEEEIIPEQIDGIPTDVIEVGRIVKQADNFRAKIRPIKPGYSCGHRQITSGTIGGIFIDLQGDPVVLSNNHVLANEGKANLGDIIYQPGPSDNPSDLVFREWNESASTLPYFGNLKQFVPLKSGGNVQDSAIARIHDKFIQAGMIDPFYPIINQKMKGFGLPSVNMQVQKIGRTTGYTTGRIIGTNASFSIGYDFGEARFENCIVCSAMSKGGDSGSLIFDMQMNAVAHLFAGSPKVTIATPLQPIIDHYGLRLWNSNPVPSIELDDGRWTISTSGGTIVPGPDSIKITAAANQYCFFQRTIPDFKSVTVTVNTGTDKGATWGPGISIVWPNGIMKVNLRNGGSFGGAFNGNYNLGVGQVKANQEYALRIRKGDATFVGEVQDGGKWFTVIELPLSVFPASPLYLTVGKTNEIGYAGDHTTLGEVGECTFRDLDVV